MNGDFVSLGTLCEQLCDTVLKQKTQNAFGALHIIFDWLQSQTVTNTPLKNTVGPE